MLENMEAHTFARLASYQFLSSLIVFTVLSLSNPKVASACTSTIPSPSPSYSNQTSYYRNNTIPYYSENTAKPSNQTSYYSNNSTIPYYSQNTTRLSNQTSYYSNNSTIPYYSQNTTRPSNQTSSTNKNSTNTVSSSRTYKNFIITSCNSSTYPSICYQYLSPYASMIEADPLQLCNVSLSLVLKAARKTSSLVSELLSCNNITQTAATVLKDCLDNVKDSIDEIKQSLDEMTYLDGIDKEFHMSTIQTYVSAAITDDVTCSDEFDEQNVDVGVRDKVRNSILNVQRMTSNALFFINNLTY